MAVSAPLGSSAPAGLLLASRDALHEWRLSASASAEPWGPGDAGFPAASPRFSPRDALAGESTGARLRLDWQRRGPGPRVHGSFHASGSEVDTRAEAQAAAERYRLDVSSDLSSHTGRGEGVLLSSRLELVLAPWRRAQLFVSASRGEPDAAGRLARTAVDPRNLAPLGRLDPAATGKRLEAGVRAAWDNGVETRLSAWRLDTDAEWLLVGEDGLRELGRPVRREGFTLGARHRPADWLDLDLEATLLHARLRGPGGAATAPFAERFATAGATVRAAGGWTARLFVSYFGARPAIKEDGARVRSSSTVSGQLTRRLAKNARLSVDVFNIFDQRVGDIDYFCASRQAGFAGYSQNFLFHPAEPRGLRIQLKTTF